MLEEEEEDEEEYENEEEEKEFMPFRTSSKSALFRMFPKEEMKYSNGEAVRGSTIVHKSSITQKRLLEKVHQRRSETRHNSFIR